MKKFGLIDGDPAWQFTNKKTGGSMISGAATQYSVMSVEEIMALDVPAITEDNCILFLWWVAAMPIEAIAVAQAWGFKVKTMTGFNWMKLTENEKMEFGMGFYSRAGSECCLIATKGSPKIVNHSVRSVILHPERATPKDWNEFEEIIVAKKRKHSQKPDEAYRRMAQLVGKNVNKLEMFCRIKRKGWSAFGNEITGSIKIKMRPLVFKIIRKLFEVTDAKSKPTSKRKLQQSKVQDMHISGRRKPVAVKPGKNGRNKTVSGKYAGFPHLPQPRR